MNYLAVDVGGTSTRAAVVAADGSCLGYGTAGSGNPTSFDTITAVTAIVAATRAALAAAATTPADITSGVVGIAGAGGATGPRLHRELISAGLPEPLTMEPDLLVAYHSGSLAPDGYVLVAGTGAAAVRIRDHQIEATADGLGWLLGDAGSGFWIGHRAVSAAAATLDGRGQPTALVDLVLSQLGIATTGPVNDGGRPNALQQLVHVVYGQRPVELARLAPLVFEAAEGNDEVAGRIVARASDALATTLGAVVDPRLVGPLVLGGSILAHQPSVARQAIVALPRGTAAPSVVTVADGVAGAIVLALRHADNVVDESVFGRIHTSLATLR